MSLLLVSYTIPEVDVVNQSHKKLNEWALTFMIDPPKSHQVRVAFKMYGGTKPMPPRLSIFPSLIRSLFSVLVSATSWWWLVGSSNSFNHRWYTSSVLSLMKLSPRTEKWTVHEQLLFDLLIKLLPTWICCPTSRAYKDSDSSHTFLHFLYALFRVQGWKSKLVYVDWNDLDRMMKFVILCTAHARISTENVVGEGTTTDLTSNAIPYLNAM